MIRHFIDIADYSSDQLRQMIQDALVMKARPASVSAKLS